MLGHFTSAQELKLEILESHAGGVNTLAMPSNSNLLFSAGMDGSLYGWDRGNGERLLDLKAQKGAIEVFGYSQNQLFSAGREEDIYVWDLEGEQLKTRLKGHKYYVESLDFCPKTNTLVSGSRDNSIKIWDMKAGVQKSYLEGHTDNVLAVAIHPKGQIAVSSGEDQCLKIWDLHQQKMVKEKLGEANITQLIFSPDGHYLAGILNKKILIWEVETWKIKYQLRGHSAAIEDFQFRPSTSTLASIDAEGKVIFWDIQRGKLIRSFIPRPSHLKALAFSNDGDHLALGFQNGMIQLWKVGILDL